MMPSRFALTLFLGALVPAKDEGLVHTAEKRNGALEDSSVFSANLDHLRFLVVGDDGGIHLANPIRTGENTTR